MMLLVEKFLLVAPTCPHTLQWNLNLPFSVSWDAASVLQMDDEPRLLLTIRRRFGLGASAGRFSADLLVVGAGVGEGVRAVERAFAMLESAMLDGGGGKAAIATVAETTAGS